MHHRLVSAVCQLTRNCTEIAMIFAVIFTDIKHLPPPVSYIGRNDGMLI